MVYSAQDCLDELLKQTARRTVNAPDDARGLYGLIDHLGQLRYIGSTSSATQSLYQRIHRRHRTGSADMSHYFSYMYNCGRMWTAGRGSSTDGDGKLAKALRNEFIADHCAAVWMPIPDHVDIPALERAVIALAPADAVAWNRKAAEIYPEPERLVDQTIARLGWGRAEMEALERQRGAQGKAEPLLSPRSGTTIPALPTGTFRFVALDVETANYSRASICQIGLAFVRPNRTIASWVSYIDPQTDDWSCSRIHGIEARSVRGAPRFDQVLHLLDQALAGQVVYQHSTFDSSAINAACDRMGLRQPAWAWRDSVQLARAAWPELKGNGGHGLASLKRHLGLIFEHHDAGEDARAAAEVVLLAEGSRDMRGADVVTAPPDLVAKSPEPRVDQPVAPTPMLSKQPQASVGVGRQLGTTRLTEGNIRNNHIYLREFFDRFPPESVGGSNAASAAASLSIDWGGSAPVQTDLDGQKKFFRKRAWIRDFFEQSAAAAGSLVSVDEIAPLQYRVRILRVGAAS